MPDLTLAAASDPSGIWSSYSGPAVSTGPALFSGDLGFTPTPAPTTTSATAAGGSTTPPDLFSSILQDSTNLGLALIQSNSGKATVTAAPTPNKPPVIGTSTGTATTMPALSTILIYAGIALALILGLSFLRRKK